MGQFYPSSSKDERDSKCVPPRAQEWPGAPRCLPAARPAPPGSPPRRWRTGRTCCRTRWHGVCYQRGLPLLVFTKIPFTIWALSQFVFFHTKSCSLGPAPRPGKVIVLMCVCFGVCACLPPPPKFTHNSYFIVKSKVIHNSKATQFQKSPIIHI